METINRATLVNALYVAARCYDEVRETCMKIPAHERLAIQFGEQAGEARRLAGVVEEGTLLELVD